jgi:hypothetical protein
MVHDVVAHLQVVEERLGGASASTGAAVGATAAGDIAFGQHGQLDRWKDEPPLEWLYHHLDAGQSFVAEAAIHARRRACALRAHHNPKAIGDEPAYLLHEPVALAHHGIPAGRGDGARARSLRRGGDRPRRRSGVREQAVERQVQSWELDIGTRAPRRCQRRRQRRLLVEQLGGAVAHAPRVDEEHLRLVVDEVGEEVLALGQPRQPRLHAVEREPLRQPLPLLPSPRFRAH